MRKLATYACIVTMGVVGLAACGSDSGGGGYVAPTGPPVKVIKLSAKNFMFTPAKVTSPAGIIEFDVESTDGIHDLVIEGQPGFQVEVSGSGSKASGKIKLSKGKYTFYCDISGHRAQGMEGTLTVT